MLNPFQSDDILFDSVKALKVLVTSHYRTIKHKIIYKIYENMIDYVFIKINGS